MKSSDDFISLESDLDFFTKKSLEISVKKRKLDIDLDLNGKFYQNYLKQLVKQPRFFSKLGPVHSFLQLSGFNQVLGDDFYYQSFIKKRVGGQYTTNCCMKMIRRVCRSWRQRWFAITGEGICYAKRYEKTSEGIVDMLFFDRSVRIRFGKKFTGEDFGRDFLLGIAVYTSSRKLTIRAKDKLQTYMILKALHDSISLSHYILENRFNSFSPVRFKNVANFFINAEGYYRQLFEDLSSARHEIFIRGWWICPELYLKRPIEHFPQSRLDRVLEKAAKRGVKVYVVLFKEYKGPMPNDSEYVKERLESLDTNIRIIRHPSNRELPSTSFQHVVSP